MADPEVPPEALQAAAEVLRRQHDSEYEVAHLPWEAFLAEALAGRLLPPDTRTEVEIRADERGRVCAELIAFARAQPKLSLDGFNALLSLAPAVVRGDWAFLGGRPEGWAQLAEEVRDAG